jgi:myosin-3
LKCSWQSIIFRCIRPNEENVPDQFDGKKVTTQLKYTGVLETTRIRREGYSHRIPFNDFINRYVSCQVI